MDTSTFFRYPGLDAPEEAPGFLADRDEDDWALLLDHTETRLFRAGDVVLANGETDRALYLLLAGRLATRHEVIHPIATVGEAAFLDGRPRAVTLRALSGGEVARLDYDAFLALAARRPDLGRAVLLDVGRILASRLRGVDGVAGWTG